MNSRSNMLFNWIAGLEVCLDGQLLIMWATEKIVAIDPWAIKTIQCNTDGNTFYAPTCYEDKLEKVRKEVESISGIDYELNTYDVMHLKDVSNYIAIKDGKAKVKGASLGSYIGDYKSNSLSIVKEAAYLYLTKGTEPVDTITEAIEKNEAIKFQKIVLNKGSQLSRDSVCSGWKSRTSTKSK